MNETNGTEIKSNQSIVCTDSKKNVQQNNEQDLVQRGRQKLPDGWSYESRFLLKGSKKVANFLLFVTDVSRENEHPSKKQQTYITIMVVTKDETSISKKIPFTELKALDYQMDLGTKCHILLMI